METAYKIVARFCREYNDSYFIHYETVVNGLLEYLPKIGFKNKASIKGLNDYRKQYTWDFNRLKQDVDHFNYGLRTNFYDFFMRLWDTLDHLLNLTIKNFNFKMLQPYITLFKFTDSIKIVELYELYFETKNSLRKLATPVWNLKGRRALMKYRYANPVRIQEINIPEGINKHPDRELPVAMPIEINRPTAYANIKAVRYSVTNGQRRTRKVKTPKSKSPIEVNLNAPNEVNLNRPLGTRLNGPIARQ
jgi:hypothetical protein